IEQELERGLVDNLKKLILELGQGFAFIGRQYSRLIFFNTEQKRNR
ncbi:DUF1016 family protein, partial [bacterium]|nr:DUF1016 family protein [bacterium]